MVYCKFNIETTTATIPKSNGVNNLASNKVLSVDINSGAALESKLHLIGAFNINLEFY